MSRIVANTDGLIKLGKSGALEALLRAHEVLVPTKVYEEAVFRGKQALYEDASRLEATLERHDVNLWPSQELRETGEQGAEELAGSFGYGERAAFRLYIAQGADAILSDDRAFAEFLARRGIPIFASADAVVAMAESGELGPDEGVECLGKLEPHIRKEVFESALYRVRSIASSGREEKGE